MRRDGSIEVARLAGGGLGEERLDGADGRVGKLLVHRELAAMGVFLEYDSPSRLKYGPDADAVSLIRAAVEGGYERQILLGLDFARRSYYPTYGGGPGLGYLLETVTARTAVIELMRHHQSL